jgi:hypothetical protein
MNHKHWLFMLEHDRIPRDWPPLGHPGLVNDPIPDHVKSVYVVLEHDERHEGRLTILGITDNLTHARELAHIQVMTTFLWQKEERLRPTIGTPDSPWNYFISQWPIWEPFDDD